MINPSIKKHMIPKFTVLPLIEEYGGNKKLHIVTALGIISGIPMLPFSNDKEKNVISEFITTFSDEYKNMYSEEYQHPFDGYVTLQDVEITYSTGQTKFFKSLMVFVDQIIGITVDSIDA